MIWRELVRFLNFLLYLFVRRLELSMFIRYLFTEGFELLVQRSSFLFNLLGRARDIGLCLSNHATDGLLFLKCSVIVAVRDF